LLLKAPTFFLRSVSRRSVKTLLEITEYGILHLRV
jgi:hypothetical protein